MTTPAFNWCGETVPPEVKQTIDDALVAQSWLLPPWLYTVWVEWNPCSDDERVMSVTVKPHYRFAKIWVYPAWLSQTPEDRAEHVIHEFLHLSLNAVPDWSQEFIERLCGDDKRLHATAELEITARLEASVCDLARMIRRRLASGA